MTSYMLEEGDYTEEVSSFLVTEDGRRMVIIGNDYHYVFKIDNNLHKILMSKNRKFVRPNFWGFKVDVDNRITGNYRLFVKPETRERAEWFVAAGFSELANRKGNESELHFTGGIKGIRYRAIEEIPAKYKFNKTYEINITEEDGGMETVTKKLFSPVTATADGVLVIGGFALFVSFYMLMAFTGNCDNPDMC